MKASFSSSETATRVVNGGDRSLIEEADARRLINNFKSQLPPFSNDRATAFDGNTRATRKTTWKQESVKQEETSSLNPTISAAKDLSRALAQNHLPPVADSVNRKQPTQFSSIVDDPRSPSHHLYFLVLLVHSETNATERRNVIRSTWLSGEMTGGVSIVFWFVLGVKGISAHEKQHLMKEQLEKGDLLMLWDVYNNYESLSERTLRSMHYIYAHYDFIYFLKTDDDMFLNLPILLYEMEDIMPRKRLYWGSFSCHNPPQTNGRWLETRWHSCDVYFPYAYGGMYVMTKDVVGLIARNAPSLPLYCCEDVSVGSWLAPYNLHRVSDVRIFVEHRTRCSKGFIAIHITKKHRLASKLISKYYMNLKRKGSLCSKGMKMGILSWESMPGQCWEPNMSVV